MEQTKAHSPVPHDKYDNRLQHLEARTYHIDGELTGLKSQMGGVIDSLRRIESGMMNKPAPNYLGVISLGVTILFGAFALTGGLAAYMNTQMGHVRDDVQALWDKQSLHEEFRHQMHFEIGGIKNKQEYYQTEIEKLWVHIHKLEEEDKDHAQLIAENQMRSRAIGDYVKKMDEQGTHWGNMISKDAAQAIGRIQGMGQ